MSEGATDLRVTMAKVLLAGQETVLTLITLMSPLLERWAESRTRICRRWGQSAGPS